MKKLLLPVLICFISILAAQTPDIKYTQELKHYPTMGCCPDGPMPDYSIKFRDDFDGTVLNSNVWMDNFPKYDHLRYYWINNQEPVYFGAVDENVFVNHGTLKLLVDTIDPNKTYNGKAVKYSVGQIWSKQQWRYGKFECRFKVPQGEAFLPAFWMQSYTGNGYDEIDIVEAFGNWGGGSDPFMQYKSGGTLNSAAGSYDAYDGTQIDATHIAPLTSNEWHLAILEWTPYFLKVTIDGVLTNEQYRYYRVCDGRMEPIKCSENSPLGYCREEKYIENMAFPDDYMNVTFWLNLQPVADWWGKPISQTNTPIPAIEEIDYMQVEQLPQGTWGECENKLFCTYSVQDHKENSINICTDGITASPNVFYLYPELDNNTQYNFWKNYTFTYSNNIDATVGDSWAWHNGHPKKAGTVTINTPYPKNETSWFQFEISENANNTCIGQDRIFKKTLNFIEPELPKITLDAKEVEENKKYYVLNGSHTIKADIQNIANIISCKIEISYEGLSSLLFSSNSQEINFSLNNSDFITNYIVKIILNYKTGCYREYKFKIKRLDCAPPSVIIDGQPITDIPFSEQQTFSLCYGNHNFSLLSGSNYNIYSASIGGATIPVVNNSFLINSTTTLNRYYVSIQNENSFCNIMLTIDVIGVPCLSGNAFNGNCALEAHPNPASQNLAINAASIGTLASGYIYTPLISEINIYNRYMQPVKRISSVNSTNYTLSVLDLTNNEFYIVESKDQYGNSCRKTIMIAR